MPAAFSMTNAYTIAAIWLGLAVVATVLANHIRISTALVEICVGIAAGTAATRYFGADSLGSNLDWLRFLAGTGAVVLTFLAGAELEPAVLRAKWKEVSVVGAIGFAAPFLGCTAAAYYLLHWDARASWLAGVALSTTSMAVVYAVMLETGFNKTDFGKGILGACFINDLGTVIALGLIFAPFTYKTAIFVGTSAVLLGALPFLTGRLTRRYAFRTAAIRTKWVLLVLFGLGALALWSGSEAVLPAYIAGMALAGAAAQDQHWVRRLRTLTVGLLTPFYFIRAGSLVGVGAILAAPAVFFLLLGGKVVSKIFGLYPVIGRFRENHKERWYYTLMMSTGLTFGTISALYGLSHSIVTREQYSFLVAVVMASAVVPTLIAGLIFLPRHLLEVNVDEEEEIRNGDTPAAETREGRAQGNPAGK
ncbi:MAG: cation:proton antiporter [Candidatus Brocadiia bacterium]|jgi:Kef-type K+ transport system membrane component KefB